MRRSSSVFQKTSPRVVLFLTLAGVFLLFTLVYGSQSFRAQLAPDTATAAFRAFDEDQNGVIENDEAIYGWSGFRQAINSSPAATSPLKKWDVNNSGRVDFGDMSFVAQTIDQNGKRSVIDIFNAIDTDSDGLFANQELTASSIDDEHTLMAMFLSQTTCGDGIIEPTGVDRITGNADDEQCDDGNAENADSCSNTCKAPRCGDSIVQAAGMDGNLTTIADNESCDLGDLNSNTGTCTLSCKTSRCGDGFQQGTEQCDDGNSENADTCTNTCTSPRCGDSIVQAGEQCDDGNTTNEDSCTNTCVSPRCGDAIVQTGEQCDDGNTVNTDACTITCTAASCGDGFQQSGEQCDDGNVENADSCSNTCQSPRCGDAIVQSGEQCDDGNTNNVDSCTNACTIFVAPSSSSSSVASSVSSSLHGSASAIPLLELDRTKYNNVIDVTNEAQLKAFLTNQTANTIVRLADGTYNALNVSVPGNDALRLTKPYVAIVGRSNDPSKVIIEGRGMASNGAYPVSGFATSHTGSVFAYMTIQNFWFHDIKVEQASDVVIHGMILRNAGEQMLKVNQTAVGATAGKKVLNGLVQYSEFSYDNEGMYNYINGIDLIAVKDWVVRNNTFRNIRIPAIEASPQPNPGFAANPAGAILIWKGSENVTIENNTIINSDRGIIFGLGQTLPTVRNGIIRNNVIIRTELGHKPDAGIVMENAQNVSVLHNTVYLVGPWPNAIEYRFSTTNNITIKNNLINKAIGNRALAQPAVLANNVINAGSAWFTNLAAGDAHLTHLASSAHNTAAVLTPTFPDRDGNPRGATPDIGAYESSFAPSSSASSVVSSTQSSIVSSSTSSSQPSAPIVCGDGIVQPNGADGIVGNADDEQCDAGTANSNAGACTTSCKAARCGDAIVQTGEQCDDGNTVNTDACTITCTAASCGDGFQQSGEQCDDGNTENADSCSNACQSPRCGDSIVQSGEQCDDGNTNNTDSCTNGCTIFVAPSSSSSSSSSQVISSVSSSSAPAVSSSRSSSLSSVQSSRSSSVSSLHGAASSSAPASVLAFPPMTTSFAITANASRVITMAMTAPNDRITTLEWSNLPFMSVRQTGAKTWEFTFNPTPENVGPHTVYLALSDGMRTVRSSFDFRVTDPVGALKVYQVEATGFLPTQTLVTWSINNLTASSKILFHKNNDPDTVQTVGPRTQYSLTNLTPNTQYTFRIQATVGTEVFTTNAYTFRTPSNATTITGLQALHRSGQTFLTWNEVASPTVSSSPSVSHMRILIELLKNIGPRYLVYRSSQPITSVTGMTPVAEVLPLNIWNTFFYGEDPRAFKNPTPRYTITNGGEPLNIGTGLAVHNANQNTSSYYAVVFKQGTQVSAPAALTNPVAETVGTGTPILQRSFLLPLAYAPFVQSPTQYYYTRWEYAPMNSSPLLGSMWKRPESVRPFDYLVAVPENVLHPAPAYLALHAWSAHQGQQYHGWINGAYNGAIMVSGNQVPYSFWTGYKGPDGKVHAYNAQQMLSFLDWAKQQPQFDIDPKRVFIGGASMGGSGAPSIAIRNPDRFAWVVAAVGIHIPKMSDHFKGAYASAWSSNPLNNSTDASTNNVLFEDGTPVWDYFDDEKYLRSHPTVETPYIFFANGTNDAGISWPQAMRFYEALRDTKRPFSFNWYDGGHGTVVQLPSVGQPAHLMPKTMPLDIRNDQAVPAFRNGSLDDNPGVSPFTLDTVGCLAPVGGSAVPCHPVGGVIKGQVNAYYVWETIDTGPDAIVDTPTRFEMTIRLLANAPADTATVDMTPRRLQQFRVSPGAMVSYTVTPKAGGAAITGTVAADQHGFVTLVNLPISKVGTRIIINAPQLSFLQTINSFAANLLGNIMATLLGK